MAELVLEPEAVAIARPDISHLVTEDDTPVDNIFSEKQQRLLTEPLYSSWKGGAEKRPFVALANVGLFFAVDEPAIVPDALISLDVTLPEEVWEKRHRSYFMWEYGKPPDVVVEVVSNRQGGELGRKKSLYARLGIAWYIVYDPERQLNAKELHLFERRGSGYIPTRRMWLPEVGLGVQLWTGTYADLHATWLRWCDQEGNLLLTGEEAAAQERDRGEQERERAEQERQRAEQEYQRAEQEHERAERLAAQLRALGVEPEA